jgi:hypothetical protein
MKEICDCKSYVGEERRNCERRCGGERRSGTRGGEDRRREERRRAEDRRKKLSRKRTFFWLLIILFVSLVLSAFIGTFDVFIEKYFSFKDESYRPMDLDRIRHELEKSKSVDKR